MKVYKCPECDSQSPVRPVECPTCGASSALSEWKEFEVDKPKPTSPKLVELHGDLGRPFVFRKQMYPMGVGRPSLTNVASQANCCEREQFILSWDGDCCFISTPGTLPRNATYVDGIKLVSKTELRQGSTIDLRGATTGRVALPLTVLYS